jgi:hypothetical protein
MEKDTITLDYETKHVRGYGCLNRWWQEESNILDKIIEWSKEFPEKKVYKHQVRTEETNVRATEFYDFKGMIDPVEPLYTVPPSKIPYCDLVVYLDIWWQ